MKSAKMQASCEFVFFPFNQQHGDSVIAATCSGFSLASLTVR